MPPKAKFTKDEIVNAALNMVRENGFDSLTARSLGVKLGSSARPIFTVFESMDEVHQSVLQSAKALYKQYVDKGLQETPAFKGVGRQYIRFAKNEPKLFQLLFMKEPVAVSGFSNVLSQIEESYEEIFTSIERDYGLDKHAAEKLYRHLWIYTHGIATLCATKVCVLTGDEIACMMTEVFKSLIKEIKSGKDRSEGQG